MKRMSSVSTRFTLLVILSVFAAFAVACSSGGDEDPGGSSTRFHAEQGGGGSSDGPSGITVGEGSLASERAAALNSGNLPVPQATVTSGGGSVPAPSRPQITPDSGFEFSGSVESDSVKIGDSEPSFDTGTFLPAQEPLSQPQAQVGQDRIIVRNVDMSIETPDPAATIEQVSGIVTNRGGWVVRTQSLAVHEGQIDVRIPADQLDDFLAQIRGIASEVVSEVSTSQDFTEEFTDMTARIQTLQDTVDALRELFSRAEEIEDALDIQREITRIQSDIEAMQARVNFLSESAAFSLVRLSVLALPQEIVIDAGEDKLAAVGRQVRFRAEFTPPEGIDNFRIGWDFGDGTGERVVTAVAPVDTEGRVISAPVVHVYSDETDSPYIVTVNVTGVGESGAIEGEDVIVVTVNRVPPIEVFVGETRFVDEGEQVTLSGSFTRPEGIESLEFTWDFGDGTAPVTVQGEADATEAEIEHIYTNSRGRSYLVQLTVRGETPAGSTEGSSFVDVFVEEPESITSGVFRPGDSGRSALRTLSSIAGGLGTALIWIGVLSPLWIAIAVAAYVVYRRQVRANDAVTNSETQS